MVGQKLGGWSMSSEWKTTSFKDAPFEIIDGDRGVNYPKQNEFYPSGHCLFLNAGNVTKDGFSFVERSFINAEKDSVLRKGKLTRYDLVLTTRGTVGNVGYYGDNVKYQNIRINSGMVIIRPDVGQILPYYLYLFLRSRVFREQMSHLTSGSAQPQLPIRDLNRIELLLPSIQEQQHICNILGTLDDRITLLRETNKTLESIAQAIFKSWFVDFDPVRAKMEGRQPEGMDQDTAALFPDSFEETEMGEVPRGWCQSTVGQIFNLTMGQSPPGHTYNNVGDGLPFYQGRTDFGYRFPSKRIFCTKPSRTASIGDTLVSVRAPVGDVNMAMELSCLGRGVAAVCHPQGFNGFTFYTMKTLGSQFQTYDSEGTVFGSINKKDFEALKVIAPQVDVLKCFDESTAPLDNRIVENENLIRTLTEIRDTLLPRLISGQLRLPEAQEQIKAALS